MGDLTTEELQTINDLVLGTTVVSFLGSLFIFSTLLYYQRINPNEKLNKFAYRLVFNIAISDLIYEISFWFTDPNTHSDSAACEFSGFCQQFGTLASVLWILLITYSIHEVIANPHKMTDIQGNMVYYHAGIWGGSFLTALLPLTSNSYGQAGGWCWIMSDSGWDIAWRFLIFYGPVWIIIGYICWIYYASFQTLGMDNQIMRRMGLYPLILIVSWTFGTINRIVQAASGDNYGLICFAAFLMSLYGFLNFLAYIYTPQVREVVFGWDVAQDTTQSSSPRKAEPAYDMRTVKKGDVEMNFTEDDDYVTGSETGMKTSSFNVDIGISDLNDGYDDMGSRDVIFADSSGSNFQLVTGQTDSAIEVQEQPDHAISPKTSEHI